MATTKAFTAKDAQRWAEHLVGKNNPHAMVGALSAAIESLLSDDPVKRQTTETILRESIGSEPPTP